MWQATMSEPQPSSGSQSPALLRSRRSQSLLGLSQMVSKLAQRCIEDAVSLSVICSYDFPQSAYEIYDISFLRASSSSNLSRDTGAEK